MVTFTCPSCRTPLNVTAAGDRSRSPSDRSGRRQVRPSGEIEAVVEVARLADGVVQTSDLWRAYRTLAEVRGLPELGQRNFGIAMAQAGFKRVRKTNFRGWDVGVAGELPRGVHA